MIVNHKEPNIMGWPYGTLENRKTFILKPGINEVPQEVWESVRGLPVVQARIEEGRLEVVSEDEKPAEVAIKGLKPEAALKMIEDCVDLDMLKSWQGQSKSPKVTKALAEKIKLMEAPVEYRNPTA